MADVFSRLDTNLAGVFAADHSRLSFGPRASTALVQNLSGTYMQNVTRLYEVGGNGVSANVYYVGGRAQGQMSLARVIGPQALLKSFYKKFGNVCNAPKNMIVLHFTQLNCTSGEAKYTFKYCVLTQIGISVQDQDMIVNEANQLMFSSMEFEDGTANLEIGSAYSESAFPGLGGLAPNAALGIGDAFSESTFPGLGDPIMPHAVDPA